MDNIKKTTLISLCCLLILIISCELPLANQNSSIRPGKLPPEGTDYKIFSATDFKENERYELYAVKLSENDVCIVYKDYWQASVKAQDAESIAKEYKDKIYPKVSGVFGEPLDVDENKKLIIILLDIIDGMGTNSFVAGYFDSANMYLKTDYAYSNEAEILYMDVQEGKVGSSDFYATIAHEFQHLLRFSDTARRKDKGEKINWTETWLDEGLSTAAEYIYLEEHPKDYPAYYNSDPYGAIARGNTFYYWDNKDYAEYVTVYLFFQWLRIQAGGNGDGYAIYRKICETSLGNYRGVVNAAQLLIGGDINSWDTLLSSWFLANYMNTPNKNTALGLYGYNGELKLTAHPVSGTSLVTLRPGEGVYSKINGSFTPSDSGKNIKYIGASEGSEPNGTAPFKQNYLLTFNGNSNNKGSVENGRTTGVRAAENLFRSAGGEAPPFKIRLDGTRLLPPP
jgi:hypothetical protein